MAERLQTLRRKLKGCVKEVSDEEVSQCMHKMLIASETLPDSFFDYTEWKGNSDDSAAKVYSNIINLVQVVEDVVDLYYFLMSKPKSGKTGSSNNELREISAKMRQFLRDEREFLSQILVFFHDATQYFLNLLKKFSDKVCKVFNELKMALWQNSEQPGSKPEQKVNRMEISRNSAQQRRAQNHEEREGNTRQETAKLSLSESSIGLRLQGSENIQFGIEKLPSKHNITVEFSDECKNASFHVNHGTPKVEELVGRDMEMMKLLQLCTEKKSDPLPIVVTGVAGVGKTSLAKAFHKKVKRQFDCYAWVDMFEKSTSNVFRDMLNSFSKTQPMSCPPSNASTMDEASLRKKLSSFLTKKFLLVLDDITSQEDWTSVKEALPQNNHNGRVIMTSRLSNFSSCTHIIKLEALNPADSYNLLFNQHQLGSDEKSIVEEICKLCEYNPLAITIIRSMLSLQKPLPPTELYLKLCDVQSTNERNKVHSSNETQRGLNNVILLCYSTLQPRLKSCFLYGALFPPPIKIPCRKLIRCWIAEGFIDEKKDMTMEEVGELQLEELLDRNMFHTSKKGIDGKPKSCRVLRPLQEFANKRAQLDRFFSRAEFGKTLQQESSLRLSLIAGESNCNTKIDKTYQTQLRSFLLLKGEILQDSQMKYFSFSRFKLLILLDLEGVPIKILPDSVGNLCLLHYLGLRRTELIELPSSIGRLIRLETLDIRDTFVRDLPQDLERLNKLRHLLLASSFDHKVVNMPVDIASFKDLQTLAGVKLTKRMAEQLKELHQIQKLSLGKVKRNLLTQLADSIENMESLRSLTIKCDLGEQIHARSFKSLLVIRTLRIEGEVLDMLGWIKNLKSLTLLELRDCVLKHDPFVALANMSNLVCLSVQNAYVGESIQFQKYCFPSLRKLSIADFQALSQWYMDDGALENLEKFTIGSCPKLTSLPRHFKKLAYLRVMQVIKMPEAFVKEAKQLGENKEKLFVVVHGSSEAQFHPTTISIKNEWHK